MLNWLRLLWRKISARMNPSERRFRDDGTKATRSYKPEDGDDRLDENDEDLVHAGIVSKSQKNPGIQADFVFRHRQDPKRCKQRLDFLASRVLVSAAR